MYTTPTVTAAIARQQIEDRIREAEARRIARAVRAASTGDVAVGIADVRPRRTWRWNPFPRRAFT